MNDQKPAGEEFDDVMEDMISSASPLEDDTTEGGTDRAARDGEEALGDNEALGDDEAFSA